MNEWICAVFNRKHWLNRRSLHLNESFINLSSPRIPVKFSFKFQYNESLLNGSTVNGQNMMNFFPLDGAASQWRLTCQTNYEIEREQEKCLRSVKANTKIFSVNWIGEQWTKAMASEREKYDKSKTNSSVKHIPKDAQVIMSIMKELNVTDYEPRVINQLLEFTYRKCINWLHSLA